MVLKILILLLLTINLHAEDNKEIKRMKIAVANIDNDRNFNNSIIRYENMALELEEAGEYDFAAKIYKKILKKRYNRYNKLVLKSHRDFEELERKIPDLEKIKYYYTRLASLYVIKYEAMEKQEDEFSALRLRKRVNLFLKVLRRVGAEDTAESLADRLDEKDELRETFVFERNLYPYLSYISWQDFIYVTRNDGSGRSTVLNTFSGSCSGAGMRWKNQYHEYHFESCYIFAQSTSSPFDGPLSYTQKNVDTQGVHGGLGYMNHSLLETLSFGGQINYLYRSGSWDTPSDATLEDTSYIRLGASFRTTFFLEPYALMMSMGKILNNKSMLFLISSQFHF